MSIFTAVAPAPARTVCEQMNVLVASRDALLARRALLACPGAAIVRCLPMHQDAKVQLEIHFPAGQGAAVIGHILASLPHGEIGGIGRIGSPDPLPPVRQH